MEAGQQIHEYILEEQIGRGGMGVVWRARHRRLDRVVAIKAIYPHLASDAQLTARFLDEAKTLAALHHPRIVSVHDFFALHGDTYLVMDYIPGKSLQSRLQELKKTTSRGCLPLSEAFQIAQDILGALESAHDKGIIHRDVKPSNIIVTPAGEAYLVDFGIALMRGVERHTQVGGIVGTEKYMSPEQSRGEEPDLRTDIYSFGCVLYEMLAGRPPFSGDALGSGEYALRQAHPYEPPAPVRQWNPEVNAQTEAVVQRALAHAPADRFERCQDMATALQRASRSPHDSPPVPPDPRPWRQIIVRGGIALGVILVLLVLIKFSIDDDGTLFSPDTRKNGPAPGKTAQDSAHDTPPVVESPMGKSPMGPEGPHAGTNEQPGPAVTQSGRTALTISAQSKLPLRVISRPFSTIYKEPNASKGISQAHVPTFQAYYVYTRPQPDAPGDNTKGWYEVGSNARGAVLGWMKAEDVIEWKQTMCLAYTTTIGREPVLMFKDKNALSSLIQSEDRPGRVRQLYTRITSQGTGALPEQFPVLSVEPKRWIDLAKQFYLLPIIDFEAINIGPGEGRMVKLAAATARGPDARDIADIRKNPSYHREALRQATDIAPDALKTLQADIVFVVDTTISMQPYINEVLDVMRQVVTSTTKETQANIRLGFWGYRTYSEGTDHPDIEYNTRNYTPQLQAVETFLETLAQVHVARVSTKGYKEDVFAGVDKAMRETPWRDGALRFVILIGDAPGYELGHPQNHSKQSEQTLRLFANDHKIRIATFQIKDPRYPNYHGLGEAQFRALATNKGAQAGPTYTGVAGGDTKAFTHRMQDVMQVFVEMMQRAAAGQLPEPASLQYSNKGLAPPSPMRKLALDMGYAALVEWVGQTTNAKAPRDIIAWAVDKDLLDPSIPSMEVRMLLNKRQLDSLSKVLQEVITAGRMGRTTGSNFFTALQAIPSVASRDPDQLRNAVSLKDSGLIPDFLSGLPYQSNLMTMSNDLWASLSDDKQNALLRKWESLIEFYISSHNAPGNWILLNKEDDSDEAVYAIPLDALP